MTSADNDRGGNQGAGIPATDESPVQQQKASLLEDFIEIFYAPSSVFARRDRASFWAPFLIVSAVAALLSLANLGILDPIISYEVERAQAQAMADNPQLTAEMAERARAFGETITKALAVIGMPIAILAIGVALWLVGKIFGAKMSFNTSLLVASFAAVPRLVQQLSITVQGLVLDTSTMTSIHELSLSPARFVDPESMSRQMINILGRFDLFTIWATVLLGIGLAVAGKLSRVKAVAGAVIIWVIGGLFTLR